MRSTFWQGVSLVAVILSVFTGITHGISICAWAAAVLCLVFARLCDAREAKWMEDTVDVTATVENIQKVHLMVPYECNALCQ